MSWKKLLLIPGLVYYRARAPRDPRAAWDQYWKNVRRTGSGGDVLWDAAGDDEIEKSVDSIVARMDRSLPMVDVGCGNGRYARAFARRFPKVLGVDVSPTAIARAREETGSAPNVSFRELDVAAAGAGRRLRDELGESNAFSRGVLHILDDAPRAALLDNLRELLGQRGVLYLLETDFDGGSLDYLESVGTRPGEIPTPIRLCAESGLAPPRHFGDAQRQAYFSEARWEMLANGPIEIPTLSLTGGGEAAHFPGYFAAVRPRA